MAKTLLLERAETNADGVVSLRFIKQETTDTPGGQVVTKSYHRVTIEPGQDIDIVLRDVENDKSLQGFGGVRVPDEAIVRARVAHAHTPQTVADFEQKMVDLGQRVARR